MAKPLKTGDNGLAHILGILDDKNAHCAPNDS
jgi:hypothetical protein